MALIAYFAPKSERLKDINLKSKYGDLKTVYLTIESENNECLVTDRYATTLRRSDEADDVRKSWCFDGKDRSILVQRKKKKSMLLIPLENFSREDIEQVNELKLEWIALYQDRLEKGKYLKVPFPEDSWREYKRSKKERRIIGLYSKNKVYAVDTLLRPVERYNPETVDNLGKYVVMKIEGESDKLLPNIVMTAIENINFKDYILKNFRAASK